MSRREYLWTFFDIDGRYQTLTDVKDLSESEWEVKRNKHNINILDKRFEEKKELETEGIPICNTMEEVYKLLKSPTDIDRVFIKSGKESKILVIKG